MLIRLSSIKVIDDLIKNKFSYVEKAVSVLKWVNLWNKEAEK